jgi:hypothetical protein
LKSSKPTWKFEKKAEKKEISKFFTDGLIIALTSGVGYTSAFLFEYGYAKHFGIPIYFISPTAPTIAAAIFITATLVLGLTQIAGVFDLFLRESNLPRLRVRMNILFVLCCTTLAQYGISWKGFVLMLFFTILVAGHYFLAVLDGSGNFTQRMEYAEKYRDPAAEADVVTRGVLSMGEMSAKIYIAVVFGSIISMAAGAAAARLQADYQVIKDIPGYVLVKRYGDTYVAAGYDSKNKKISEELMILKDDEVKKMTLKNERIGPLDCAICLKW